MNRIWPLAVLTAGVLLGLIPVFSSHFFNAGGKGVELNALRMGVVLVATIPICSLRSFEFSTRSFFSGVAVSVSSLFYLTSIETLSISFALTIVFGLPALFSVSISSTASRSIRLMCALFIVLSFVCLNKVTGASPSRVSLEGVAFAVMAGVLIFLFGFLAHDRDVDAIVGFGSFAIGGAVSGFVGLAIVYGAFGMDFVGAISWFDIVGATTTCLIPYFLMKVAANLGNVTISTILIGFLMEPVVATLYETLTSGNLTFWGILALLLVLVAAYLNQRARFVS